MTKKRGQEAAFSRSHAVVCARAAAYLVAEEQIPPARMHKVGASTSNLGSPTNSPPGDARREGCALRRTKPQPALGAARCSRAGARSPGAPAAKIEVLGDDGDALEDSAHASDDDELNVRLCQGLEDLLDEVLHPSEPSARKAARTRACEAVRSALAAAPFDLRDVDPAPVAEVGDVRGREDRWHGVRQA
jgi:hypothetical protein